MQKLEYISASKVYKSVSGDNELIVGNEKNALAFEPHIKVTKWNKENSLIIKHSTFTATEKFEADTAKLADTDKEFYSYTIEDGFKFGVNLLKKPSTNVITFQLEGHEEYDFWYQPPLKNENPDGSRWEQKEWGLCEQPADVVGSYAVYHKTKRDHIIGKTNYATGKFCHIYRPRLIDSKGNFVWADLNIEKGVYTVTIPQKFLDTATYPVKSNDTFGYTSIGAGSIANTAGYSVYFRGQSGSAGTASAIKCCLSSDGDDKIKMCLYSDSSSEPNSLIANSSTGELTITRTTKPTQDSEWTSGSISATIAASTYFWLSYNAQTSTTTIVYYDSGSGSEGYQLQTYAAFPSDPAPGIAHQTLSISIYCEYSSGASYLSNVRFYEGN